MRPNANLQRGYLIWSNRFCAVYLIIVNLSILVCKLDGAAGVLRQGQPGAEAGGRFQRVIAQLSDHRQLQTNCLDGVPRYDRVAVHIREDGGYGQAPAGRRVLQRYFVGCGLAS